MAIKLVSRSAWGARAPRGGYDHLASTRGVKIHYTGGRVDPRLATDHGRCADTVRSIQRSHMDGNGWIDIGYSMCVCPHRHVFVGRGPHRLPAANGPGLNAGHYAVLGLVGSSGLTRPSTDMLHGIRDAITYLREKGDAGSEIKGHRDGYPTSCPGAPLYAWVRRGAPRPETDTQEDDVPETVSLGCTKPKELPPGKWVTVHFDKEFSDEGGHHAPGNYPSILKGGHKFALTASFTIEGLASGVEGQVRAVAVNREGTVKKNYKIREFAGTNGGTIPDYDLAAAYVEKDRLVRLHVVQFGTAPATLSAAVVRVHYW